MGTRNLLILGTLAALVVCIAAPARVDATSIAFGSSPGVELRSQVGGIQAIYGVDFGVSYRQYVLKETTWTLFPFVGIQSAIGTSGETKTFFRGTIGKTFALVTGSTDDDLIADTRNGFYATLGGGVSHPISDRFSVEGRIGISASYNSYETSSPRVDPDRGLVVDTVTNRDFWSSGFTGLSLVLDL